MEKSDNISAYILYALLGLYYLWAYPYQMSSSDAVFYMMNARDFATGHFWDGINGYWSILISILMTPFMLIGLKGLTAFKVVQFLTGFLALRACFKIQDRYQFNSQTGFWTSLICIVLIWMMSMSHTPDLLMMTLLLYYFLSVTQAGENGNISQNGVSSGLLGGLLFLCKSYGLPFFLAHFSIWNGWRWIKARKEESIENKRIIIKSYIQGMAVFLLIVLSWSAILSVKYGHFTFGSSGKYNMAYMGPIMKFQPPYFDRFVNPETEYTANFIGEDQGQFADYGKWNLWDSGENFSFYLGLLKNNISKLYYITFIRDLTVILLLSIILILLYKYIIPDKLKSFMIAIGIFLLVYDGGYFFLFPNERYLWVNHIILTILVFQLINLLMSQSKTRLMAFVLPISFVFFSFINIQDRIQLRTFENGFYRNLAIIDDQIKSLNLEEKSMVSNIKPRDGRINDYMDPACLLMYENNFKLWGFIHSKKLNERVLGEMANQNINFFMLWDPANHYSELFKNYKVLFEDNSIGLTILQIKN